MEKISRNMIVSPKSSNKSAHILLTAMSEEELLDKSKSPKGNDPECAVLPLKRQLSEIYANYCSNGPYAGEFVTMEGCEVIMLTDKRFGSSYKYVGLICYRDGIRGDEVECWDEFGNPESGIESHQLGDYPEERYGYIAIYRGRVSNRVCPTMEEAIRELANQTGCDVSDMSPDEIFCIEVSAWVNQDEKVI